MLTCRGSRPSSPAITSSSNAASDTLAVIGPVWSSVPSIGNIPVYGTSPNVGFSPTMPDHDAGSLIDPPWSPPSAMSAAPVATSAAQPLDEPPVEYSGWAGFRTGAGWLVWLPPEKQKFSHTAFPTISPPASSIL